MPVLFSLNSEYTWTEFDQSWTFQPRWDGHLPRPLGRLRHHSLPGFQSRHGIRGYRRHHQHPLHHLLHPLLHVQVGVVRTSSTNKKKVTSECKVSVELDDVTTTFYSITKTISDINHVSCAFVWQVVRLIFAPEWCFDDDLLNLLLIFLMTKHF